MTRSLLLLGALALTAPAAHAAPSRTLPTWASLVLSAVTEPTVALVDVTLLDQGDGTYALTGVFGLNGTKEDPPVDPDAALAGLSGVTITTDTGRVFTLAPATTSERASTAVAVGPHVKGFTAELVLTDAADTPVWSGSATFAPGQLEASWRGTWTKGIDPTFDLDGARWHPTASPEIGELSFVLVGEGAPSIAGAQLTVVDASTGKPTDTVSLDAADWAPTRTFDALVRFDGDPVGSTYELTIAWPDGGPFPRTERGALHIRQPTGEGGMPGPILGVYGNGRGTRNSASNTQQTQPTGLL